MECKKKNYTTEHLWEKVHIKCLHAAGEQCLLVVEVLSIPVDLVL